MRTWISIIAVALAALCLGIGLAWLNRPEIPTSDISGANIGDPHPGFRHQGLDGEWVDAADFEGRAMLVNFWATWCPPCVREMPLLQETAERYAEKGLTVVGIALDEPEAIGEFIEEMSLDYPLAYGAADVIDTQRRWGNSNGVLPYTVLVDAGGVVRWQHLGEVKENELTVILEEWLK